MLDKIIAHIFQLLFSPLWLLGVFSAISIYLYNIATGNKERQSFKDLTLEILEYWRL